MGENPHYRELLQVLNEFQVEYLNVGGFARHDRMNLVMGICIGSTVQVALLLAPALVLISYFMGHPMNLVFSHPLDLIAVVGAVFAVNSIAADGETTWVRRSAPRFRPLPCRHGVVLRYPMRNL